MKNVVQMTVALFFLLGVLAGILMGAALVEQSAYERGYNEGRVTALCEMGERDE